MPTKPLDVFRHCRRELVVCVTLTVLLTLISLVPALTVGVILDRVIQTHAFATLLAILLAFAIFYGCEVVFTYVHDRLMLHVTHSSVVQTETQFWRVLGSAPYAELERLSEDDGLARFLSIGTDVRFRADWAVAVASIPFCLTIGISALFLVSPTLCLPIGGLTAVFLIAHFIMTQTQRHAARELQRSRERELASIDEMFRGVLSLKAHCSFDFGIGRWLASKNAYECALQKWSAAAVVQGLVGLSFERVSLAIVLGVGAYEVVSGRLSVGQLVMANMLLRQISMQVRQIAPLLHRRTAFRASQTEMATFLGRKQRPAEADTVLSVAIDLAVVVRNLTFSTPDGRLILDRISFEIPLGKSLAILGESGSGKTTLLKLLSGLYQPSSGVVLVQGRPPAARSDLVYLSQKEHLFSCSIAENVTLGRSTEKVVEQSLHHLDLGKILVAESQAAEASGQLSGGERQRIFVARALAQPDAGLLLDEPTTALDNDRRAGVTALLRSAASERKVVVFATHDSAVAAIADYTLCISNGRVRSFGQQQSTDPAKQQA